MAQPYFDKLTKLMHQAASGRHRDVRLEIKHFFSGAAVYANGSICITLTPAGLALKLPPDKRTELLEQRGAMPLRYFSKAPVKKDYAVLPASVVGEAAALRRWVGVAVGWAVG